MDNREKRAKEIFEYVEKHGIEKARHNFNISYETVTRNVRRHKQKLRENNPPAPIKNNFPKILLLDIETLPMWIRVWGLYKQRPGIKQIVKDWIILSWAAKWLDRTNYISDILTPQETQTRDDYRICKSIWNLINEADIIVAHNLQKFDIRKLNSRFMIHGFLPPSPYQTIDTLIHSQKIAAHSSHKLDWLGQLIRNEGKLDTDYDLWVKCEQGDVESLQYMAEYNREDVGLLEETYLWMRPWMNSHPNIGLYMDLKESVCSHCGSIDLKNDEYYFTPAGKYATVRCNSCGAIGRYRTSALTLNESKLLTRSTAR